MPDTQCPEITKIDTKLKYEDSVVKAWRYGDIATIVLVPGVNVNVDGSPRAYSVGNKGLANIQMGVKILDGDKYIGYEAHVEKYGKGFGSLWLEAERNNFAAGTRQFDAFALYSRPGSSIVGNGKGKPKTQSVAGESIKYYISMTSPNAQQTNFPEDDQRRYFDSGDIPAFVIPRKGDAPHDPLTLLLAERQLAWAYYPDKNRSTFAIGGDKGPKAKFSEATIAFHQLLRYGTVIPIPHYKADASYDKCSIDALPSAWNDCLYYPFYQREDTETHLKTDVLRVANLRDTIYVFFNKDVTVTDTTVTGEIIQTKGKAAMDEIGGLSNLMNCLKEIPELSNLLNNSIPDITHATSQITAAAITPPVVAERNSDVFLQLAATVGQSIPAKRLLEYRLENHLHGNPRYWAIVDFNQPSTNKRLYLFDTRADTPEKKIVKYYVAHGDGTGAEREQNGLMAMIFSNELNSDCSSLGIYLCQNEYPSERHGRSMRLKGLESTNSNAYTRAVVLHKADYVSDEFIEENGRLGRSDGCFAVENSASDILIDQLKGGSFIIAWKNPN